MMKHTDDRRRLVGASNCTHWLVAVAAIVAVIVGTFLIVVIGCRLAFAGVGPDGPKGALVPGSADCELLKDADERHMCRALTQHLKTECEFIKRPDLRQWCRVRVEGEKRP
jgi:hypothetical protein